MKLLISQLVARIERKYEVMLNYAETNTSSMYGEGASVNQRSWISYRKDYREVAKEFLLVALGGFRKLC